MVLANRRERSRKLVRYIRRSLPGPGEITVREGQEVRPEDKIGHGKIVSGFKVIHLSKELSVSPKEAKDSLKRKVGSIIYKGELLALKSGGIFSGSKVVLAPTDALIEAYDDKSGNLRLNFLPQKVDIPSSLFGIVEHVDNFRKEIIIKSEVLEIYGILGAGRQREGVLHILGKRGDLINKLKIDSSLEGQIIVGGGLIFEQALNASLNFGVKGIVTGGINASDFKGIAGGSLTSRRKFGTDVGIAILITEGFGTIPIGEDIFSSLSKYDGKFVIIDGNQAKLTLPSTDVASMKNVKSTELPKITSTLVDLLPEVVAVELKVGQTVRIIGSQFMGEQGRVVSIDKRLTKFLPDILAYMVTVETHSRKIKVPYTNLEVI